MGPCLNPNCASEGEPHPNCRCYIGMAEGGSVEHFCNQNQPHQSSCKYFAQGGEANSDFIPDAQFIPDSGPIESQNGFISDNEFKPDNQTNEQLANAAEAKDIADEAKSGGLGNQIATGLYSAAKTLHSPVSNPEDSISVNGKQVRLSQPPAISPERGKELEEANPVSSAIGTVAGLMIPGGQGAALEKAGTLVADKFAPVVKDGILAGIKRSAVKLAAENALYQTGDETSKMMQNDPNQSVSSAISNIGLAAAIGGAAGGALGAISPLWKATIGNKAGKLVEDFKARMQEHLDIPTVNAVNTVPAESATKQVFDPFTKESRAIESSLPKEPVKANFDPFTKESIPIPEPVKETKPLAQTPGGKLADMFIKRADDIGGKALATSMGYAIGHATGIPYGGTIGAILGERALSPIIESILPAIGRPMLEKLVSSEGLKSATDYGLMVVRGNKLANDAVKAILKPGYNVLKDNYKPDQKSREKLEASLLRIQKDPTHITNISGSMGHYLPDHAIALGSVATNVTSFLNTLRPVEQPKAMLDTPRPQSKVIQSEYNRALDIAQQPLVVLESIKDNTITSHDVIALQHMYPDLYKGLQQKMMNQIVDHVSKGEQVPYKTRLGLSVFMGQALDSTMNQMAIMAAQPAPEQPQAPPQQSGGKKPSQAASSNLIKGSKSMQTAAQASEAMHSTGKV